MTIRARQPYTGYAPFDDILERGRRKAEKDRRMRYVSGDRISVRRFAETGFYIMGVSEWVAVNHEGTVIHKKYSDSYTVQKSGGYYYLRLNGQSVENGGPFATRATAEKFRRIAEYERRTPGAGTMDTPPVSVRYEDRVKRDDSHGGEGHS